MCSILASNRTRIVQAISWQDGALFGPVVAAAVILPESIDLLPPQYGPASHKGYATPAHRRALDFGDLENPEQGALLQEVTEGI